MTLPIRAGLPARLNSSSAIGDAGMFYSLAEYHPKGSVGQFRSTKGTPHEIRDLVFSGYLPALCHPTVTLNVWHAVKAGGYRFNLHVEDIDLWWRLALESDIRLIPEVLVGFRQNVQSVSSANLANQAINTLFIQYLLLSHLWELSPLSYDSVRPALARLFDWKKLRLQDAHSRFQHGSGTRAPRERPRSSCSSVCRFARRFFASRAGRGVFGKTDRSRRVAETLPQEQDAAMARAAYTEVQFTARTAESSEIVAAEPATKF